MNCVRPMHYNFCRVHQTLRVTPVMEIMSGASKRCRFLTVDSDQNAVDFYKKVGFIMNLHCDYKGRDYPSMHYDIVAGSPMGV